MVGSAKNSATWSRVVLARCGCRWVRPCRLFVLWAKAASANCFAITDQNFNEVARSQSLTTTNWMPQKLERGRAYQWQVIATTAEGKEITAPSPAAPEARFKVISNEALSAVRRARQRYPASHLELGVIYARTGLLAEAEQELKDSEQTIASCSALAQAIATAVISSVPRAVASFLVTFSRY